MVVDRAQLNRGRAPYSDNHRFGERPAVSHQGAQRVQSHCGVGDAVADGKSSPYPAVALGAETGRPRDYAAGARRSTSGSVTVPG